MNNRRKLVNFLADLLGVDVSPVNEIHKLEDKSDLVYVWDLNCSDAQADGLKSNVKSEFVKRNSRDPRAIHIITNKVENFDRLGPESIREYFGPWLDQAEREE